MIHVGIDLHTRNMTLAAINDNKEQLALEKIKCCSLELERFFSIIGRPVQAVVESTANWYWLDDWCHENKIPLKLAHSKMLKAISYSKVKTDPVDARILADLLRTDMIPEAWKTEKRQRDLRELTRARLKWIQRRTIFQNNVHCIAARYNVPVETFEWRKLSILSKCLQQNLPQEAYLECRLAIEQICLIQQNIHELEKTIERQIWFHEDLEKIMDVPGIGMVSAWSILAEIGDITRFSTDKQFISYCRLVPGSKNSAGKQRHKSGSKDGNKFLKIAFSQAALGAYTHHKVIRKFYYKLRRRKMAPIARTIVAKELARIVWQILAKGQSYQGFKGKKTTTGKRLQWPHPVSPARGLG